MKRTLIVAILTIFTATSISTAYADDNRSSKSIPYVLNAAQFPQRKARFVRHTIRIQVPPDSKRISELAIVIPSGVTVKNDITVHNRAGQPIEVNSSVNESKITLDFPHDIVTQEVIEIALNQVELPRFYPIWLYRIYAKLADSNTELSIGVAEIRTRL
ncbi:hypothetical protein C7H19_23030 [Aphanothece hegewaldii CCALA 016]|uniref:DUF2808 domain-containing protein n=1 Tax=Aphanothece hegewaldii CCALA 016 TaxID=2107694 RepID=A0A2T1LRE1_9CHRO|nr:DUF2808 domain-containing protein [Aphanothece hegewaldii]PSF31261.1 hypothetical protein C7H19_23030 [Aphanothece hegewaldii CCALA 016]